MDLTVFPSVMIQFKMREVKHKLVHNNTDNGLVSKWARLSNVAVSEGPVVKTLT